MDWVHPFIRKWGRHAHRVQSLYPHENVQVLVAMIEKNLADGNEQEAIALLKESTHLKPYYVVGCVLPDQRSLMSIAIDHRALQLVRFMCLEYAPESVTLNLMCYTSRNPLRYAVIAGAEDIALFLHALDIIDVNKADVGSCHVLSYTFEQNFLRLYGAILKNPNVNLLDDNQQYFRPVRRIFESGKWEYIKLLLNRIAGDLDRLVSRWIFLGSLYPQYILGIVAGTRNNHLITQVLDHPAVCLSSLQIEHVVEFATILCVNGARPYLLANVLLRLSPKQRVKVTENCLQENMEEMCNLLQWPIRCRYLQHGLFVFTLFLLYQDGYLQGAIPEAWQRFFTILRRLPLELQMLSCRRLDLQSIEYYLPSKVSTGLANHFSYYLEYF
jgi:hypothetical protein